MVKVSKGRLDANYSLILLVYRNSVEFSYDSDELIKVIIL